MKKQFAQSIVCPACGQAGLEASGTEEAAPGGPEIRAGSVACPACGRAYEIAEGIVDLLADPSANIRAQQEATLYADRHSEDEGGGFAVNRGSIERHRRQFLAMPEGDGSELYTHGAFRNLARLAPQYHQFTGRLGLQGGESVLEIGADSCWNTARLARQGCECVAMDINHHLIVSDLFMAEYGVHFERVLGDMNNLPFRSGMFDLVFCSQVLHHSTDLDRAVREISRVLRPGGRLALFSEPMYGLLFAWRGAFFGAGARRMGVNERIYSLGRWQRTLQAAGLSPRLYFDLHQRYQRFERLLAPFRNRRIKRLLTGSGIYPGLVLEPYKADIIAVKSV